MTTADQQTWTSVDKYFDTALIGPDPVIAEVERAGEKAGLPAISVSKAQGKLLYLLIRGARAQRILEVGTLGGHSAVWMARAIQPPGRIVTFELDPRHAEVARAAVDQAGVGDLVDIRVGPAAEGLAALADEQPEPFDFVFIDADKASNATYLDYAVRLGRPGTVIVVDNVVRDGRVLEGADEGSEGVRRLVDMLADRTDVEAVAVQTVGERGYDGFLLAVVSDSVA
ncbi:O-methyltransferase [Paractinoplanes abujensis]|uniref:Putative O-methyltransferase YrrM n=1 Tax=Paractinoplanes abujensis TaxID=882441 RepID=A0A7W7G860_9ACTN|nr:O-methyltransferase [Actinoplanes abujensis]MBB4697631.1 putative O-methyltransferase YrrM [Actinoplanes abujensis]GID19880.1 O-methyltransferase [Actinoplanes abujensis]